MVDWASHESGGKRTSVVGIEGCAVFHAPPTLTPKAWSRIQLADGLR